MRIFFIIICVIFGIILLNLVIFFILGSSGHSENTENGVNKELVDTLNKIGEQNKKDEDLNNSAIAAHKARDGMTAEQVLKALGTPDSIDPPQADTSQDTKQTWHYADGIVSFGWNNTVNGTSSGVRYDDNSTNN